jgi:hypothetical protein
MSGFPSSFRLRQPGRWPETCRRKTGGADGFRRNQHGQASFRNQHDENAGIIYELLMLL